MSDTIGKLEALIISDMPKDTMNEALALLSALSASQARAEAAEEALKPFAALADQMSDWTGGTQVNITMYHVGAPTVIRHAFCVRDVNAARAAISALRQRAAMDDLLRIDGELYDVPERAALSEEDRIEVTAERLRKAAQDWACEMVDKPPYWQALAAAVVPNNQETRND